MSAFPSLEAAASSGTFSPQAAQAPAPPLSMPPGNPRINPRDLEVERQLDAQESQDNNNTTEKSTDQDDVAVSDNDFEESKPSVIKEKSRVSEDNIRDKTKPAVKTEEEKDKEQGEENNEQNEESKKSEESKEDSDNRETESETTEEGTESTDTEAAEVNKQKEDPFKEIAAELGLNPAETRHFKKMSNDSREWTIAQIREKNAARQAVKELETQYKELEGRSKGVIPASYHEHPQAYVLNPEYAALTEDIKYASFEGNFWQDQLINLKAGRPIRMITGYNQQTGQPIMSGPMTVPEGEEQWRMETQLNSSIAQCTYATQKAQTAIGALQQQHKSTYEHRQNLFKNGEKQYFPSLEDPKAPGQVYVKEFQEMFKGHDSVPMSTAAKLYATLKQTMLQLDSLKKKETTKKAIAADSKKAGPGPNDNRLASTAKAKNSNSDDKPIGEDAFN